MKALVLLLVLTACSTNAGNAPMVVLPACLFACKVIVIHTAAADNPEEYP